MDCKLLHSTFVTVFMASYFKLPRHMTSLRQFVFGFARDALLSFRNCVIVRMTLSLLPSATICARIPMACRL